MLSCGVKNEEYGLGIIERKKLGVFEKKLGIFWLFFGCFTVKIILAVVFLNYYCWNVRIVPRGSWPDWTNLFIVGNQRSRLEDCRKSNGSSRSRKSSLALRGSTCGGRGHCCLFHPITSNYFHRWITFFWPRAVQPGQLDDRWICSYRILVHDIKFKWNFAKIILRCEHIWLIVRNFESCY